LQERSDIQALRRLVAAFEPPADSQEAAFTLGTEGPDEAIGGLRRAALHEVAAASEADAAAAAGFTLGLCLRAALTGATPERAARRAGGHAARAVLWVRQRYGEAETGALHPPGLRHLGFHPQALVEVRLGHARDVLRAGVEAAACGALCAVVIEPWGEPAVLDLTATRRLELAAEASGTPVFLLRPSGAAGASAARTRFRVAAAPSRPLEANAPGHPAFDIVLVRNRAGRHGLAWRVEWNNEDQRFAEQALLRPVVSLPADRPAAAGGPAAWRRAG